VCNLTLRNELIFWRDAPADVELGNFEYLAKNWPNKIIIVCMKDFQKERKHCSWQTVKLNNVENIILENHKNSDEIVEEIFLKYPDAINIFCGIRGEKQKYLKQYIKKTKKYKLGIMAERPFIYGNSLELFFKKIAFFCLYSYYNLIYGKYVTVFLAMGRIGVKMYSHYGWDKKKLFPFMYNPKLEKVINKKSIDNEVKFLYIGRFDANSKGLDILIDSFNSIKSTKGWHLDIVGGYGDIKDLAITWANNNKNVDFIGTWNAESVCNNMTNYDVCIVPSKYDGWNLTPNQAINSGIGTIISDQAGSDELISTSASGIVVKANDINALTEAIEYVIKNPSVVMEWKQKAVAYASKISSEVVGRYFIQVMEYKFFNSPFRPICPWLKRNI
jgi:glycosyltransferase involved in cell wall biosynthesis